jgi:hypothetical protein
MGSLRLLALLAVFVVAMIAVQANAAFSAADPLSGALFLIDVEPALPVLLGLAVLIPFAMSGGDAARAAPRRRRVNRARLRARRAAA